MPSIIAIIGKLFLLNLILAAGDPLKAYSKEELMAMLGLYE